MGHGMDGTGAWMAQAVTSWWPAQRALISISAAGGVYERGMRDGQWGPGETQDGGEQPGMPHFLLAVPVGRGPGGVLCRGCGQSRNRRALVDGGSCCLSW